MSNTRTPAISENNFRPVFVENPKALSEKAQRKRKFFQMLSISSLSIGVVGSSAILIALWQSSLDGQEVNDVGYFLSAAGLLIFSSLVSSLFDDFRAGIINLGQSLNDVEMRSFMTKIRPHKDHPVVTDIVSQIIAQKRKPCFVEARNLNNFCDSLDHNEKAIEKKAETDTLMDEWLHLTS